MLAKAPFLTLDHLLIQFIEVIHTKTRSRKSCAQGDQSIAPNLRILEAFDELFLLELAILDTGLIVADSFNHFVLFLLGEALGAHLTVGAPVEHKETEEDGDNSVGEEEPLPGLEWAGLDERETVCQKATHDLLSTVHHVPDFLISTKSDVWIYRNLHQWIGIIGNLPICNSRCLFLATIPHARQNNETWLTSRLKDTEQRSDDDEASKVLASCMAGQRNTPAHNAEAEIFGNRNLRDDVVLRVFDNKDGDVDTGRKPRVLQAPR